jgi:hypothetical protein
VARLRLNAVLVVSALTLGLVTEWIVALLLLSRSILLCALTVRVLIVVLILALVEVSGLLRNALAKDGLLSLRLVLLRSGSKTRCLLGCRGGFRRGRLLCSGLPRCGGEGGLGLGGRRVLGRLAGLRLLALLIDIKAGLAVQAHAAELHSGTVNCVVTRHDNSLLLLLHAAVEAGAPSRSSGRTVSADSKPANGWAANGRLLLAGNGCEVARVG